MEPEVAVTMSAYVPDGVLVKAVLPPAPPLLPFPLPPQEVNKSNPANANPTQILPFRTCRPAAASAKIKIAVIRGSGIPTGRLGYPISRTLLPVVLTVRVEVPDPLANWLGLNEHTGGAIVGMAPLRRMLLHEKVTVALKPATGVTEMLAVADPPAATVAGKNALMEA
jgi:hypothetical protein